LEPKKSKTPLHTALAADVQLYGGQFFLDEPILNIDNCDIPSRKEQGELSGYRDVSGAGRSEFDFGQE
jgi:hypothetical protein